ncbi:MAG: hypothetical protein JNJ98_07440, partial [Gemmatimonadetes bacterium]|nr:hypothetical protein [Gemmatimonadota bacterium]
MTARTEARGADLPPVTDQHPLPAVLRANAARWGSRVALRHKDLGKWCEYSWADYADRTARTG